MSYLEALKRRVKITDLKEELHQSHIEAERIFKEQEQQFKETVQQINEKYKDLLEEDSVLKKTLEILEKEEQDKKVNATTKEEELCQSA